MIKKAFMTKSEVEVFKIDYVTLVIESEVISNILQQHNIKTYPEIESYCNFWQPTNNEEAGLKNIIQLIINQFSHDALTKKFGKHDFSYTGNRIYNNWILEFEGLTFIVSEKREVILSNKLTFDDVKKIICFEEDFCNLVLKYVMSNYDNLEVFKKKYIDLMKSNKLLNENGELLFIQDKLNLK